MCSHHTCVVAGLQNQQNVIGEEDRDVVYTFVHSFLHMVGGCPNVADASHMCCMLTCALSFCAAPDLT